MKIDKLAEIFRTVGQPTVTYVNRNNGKLEQLLRSALDESGQLCLVTGPSKTGKTTLYKEVLSYRREIPLVVQCDKSKKCDSIWKAALEAIDFDRVESRKSLSKAAGEIEGEASGKFGWSWLANVSARLRAKISKESSEEEVRSKILADPGPDLLIPVLKTTNYVLVIEDFHYLEDEEKVLLFQQWKRFVDNEVSVLVLGTTHRAVDIANSNKDLLGRITQIDVGHWDGADLEQICEKGFKDLGVQFPSAFKKFIAAEAVGLPIVVQQVCLSLFNLRNIHSRSGFKPSKIKFSDTDIHSGMHYVATIKYTQFGSYYSTLIKGPREKARKYRTYELVLACFTLDPIKFSLTRSEIDARMARLSIPPEEMPPFASMNSTLGALKQFQERRKFELLEWRPQEEILYIIEPAFLFYVRWRTLKDQQPKQLDLFEELLNQIWTAGPDALGSPEMAQ